MCIRICIYSCTRMQSDDIAVIKTFKFNGPWPLGLRAAQRKQDCVKTTWNLLQNAARFLSYGKRQAVVKDGSWIITPTPGKSAAETCHRSASGDVSEVSWSCWQGPATGVCSQSNAFCIRIHRLFEIYFNIDLPSTFKSTKQSLSFSISSQILRTTL
jgi:hypothetical protein